MSKQTDLINVTDAITVSGSNVGIGTSSPTLTAGATGVDIYDNSDAQIRLHNSTTGTTASDGLLISLASDNSGYFYNYENAPLIFGTNSTERMRINSSGNVGIGTSSPDKILHIEGSDPTFRLTNPQTTSSLGLSMGKIEWETRDASAAGVIGYIDVVDSNNFGTTFDMAFATGQSGSAAEAMRLDASGNLLVGKSSTSFNTAGFELFGNADKGKFWATRDGGVAAAFNRKTSDGDIALFAKDGSTVGAIESRAGVGIAIGSSTNGGAGLLFYSSDANIYPVRRSSGSFVNADNQVDLGESSIRFDDVYATNGNIQTSDRNEKQDIASLTATEMLVAARISGLFKTFRWIDSVADKGDNARTHTGVIAQDVQAAFIAEGLDAGDYALFTSATWWETQTDVAAVEADEDNDIEAADAYTRTDTYDTLDEAPDGATERTRMGIRYPELLAFVGAYNEQRFASIETRLAALEAV